MIKCWKTDALETLHPVSLYVRTSDRAIEIDLSAGSSGSLIVLAREFQSRINPTAETDHLDLAKGAFSYYISRRGLNQTDQRVVEVERIPEGLDGVPIGGTKVGGVQTYAVAVFEQPRGETGGP